jgi:hypothetical protein
MRVKVETGIILDLQTILRANQMPRDDTGKLKQGNFMQALDSIRREAERLMGRSDLAPEVKAGLERIVGLTRAKFDLGGDIE